MDKTLEFADNLRKQPENDGKILCKYLKYTGKIKSSYHYETWLKQVRVSLLEWFMEVCIIRAFLIFLVLLSLASITSLALPPTIALAEGISILRFLVVELKEDLKK